MTLAPYNPSVSMKVTAWRAVTQGPLHALMAGADNASMDEAEAQRVVQGTFKKLDTWDSVHGPFIPGSGSELRGDDYDWPLFGVSQVAWTGLQAAVDNFQAMRWHLDGRKTASPRHFLYAHLTLCRAALVGASQAVWVLAPDDRDLRVQRARSVVAYTQHQHERYLKALQEWAKVPHPGTDAVLARVQQRIGEMDAKRASDGQKGTLHTTEMIRVAAEHVFPSTVAVEVVLAWQEGSGAAHGLVWPILGQPSTVQAGPADDNGLAAFEAAGSFDRIANLYMAAYHLTDRGWDLLRRRGA